MRSRMEERRIEKELKEKAGKQKIRENCAMVCLGFKSWRL